MPRPLPQTQAAYDLDEQRNQILFRNPLYIILDWAHSVKTKYLPISPETAAALSRLFVVNVIVRTHSLIGIEDVVAARERKRNFQNQHVPRPVHAVDCR